MLKSEKAVSPVCDMGFHQDCPKRWKDSELGTSGVLYVCICSCHAPPQDEQEAKMAKLREALRGLSQLQEEP